MASYAPIFSAKFRFAQFTIVHFNSSVLRIPSVSQKTTNWGRCFGITVQKGWFRVGALTGTLKNPTTCLWRLEPNRRSNYFFFSPPAHLCAVTCMTEISLIVTLNNQFTFTRPCHPFLVVQHLKQGMR